MQIMLTSSGISHLDAQKRLIQIIDPLKMERRVLIITIADLEYSARDVHSAQTQEILERMGFVVDFLNLATEPIESLVEYPIIYLYGDDPVILLEGLQSSGADHLLREWHRKGHLIIGHNAGVTVLGTTIEHIRLLSEDRHFTSTSDWTGLGLVPSIILPHSNRYEDRESVIEFKSERSERLLKIQDEEFYVYENPTPEQRLDPEFILQKLADAGLEKYRADIGLLLFPSLRMELHSIANADISVGTSRVGGSADLPVGAEWPEWDECPYTFIAQINLSELPEDSGLELPQHGLLSFFYASAAMYGDYDFHGDPTTCRVIYTPISECSKLSTLVIPEALLEADPEVVLSPAAITFIPDLCVPASESACLEQLGLGWGGDPIEHERYWNTFCGSLDEPQMYHSSLHRLLGHPDQLQGDMQNQCAKMFKWSAFDTSLSEAEQEQFAREALEWRLLLQIDCDEAANIDWVGTGRIYFWIREKDLQQRVFDHVICIAVST